MRIGIGYDSHRLVEGRRLILGGVEIPFEKGLLGHSDGDVLIHAVIDSLLGAIGSGDIGRYFPDSDIRWKDASSLMMLRNIVELVRKNGFLIAWVDSVVITERPRISKFISDMVSSLEGAGIPKGVINIKAKTNEGMGFIGCGEGVAALAVSLLNRSFP